MPTLGHNLTENRRFFFSRGQKAQAYMLRRTGKHAVLGIACALFTLAGVWLLVVCRCLPQLALLLVKACMLGPWNGTFGSSTLSAAPLGFVGCLSRF